MAKKLSKGEKLDLILSEISKIRGALEALGKQKAARVGKAAKRPRRATAQRQARASRATTARALPT